MSMTRAQATTHLANEFAMLATDAAQLTTDVAAGFGPALDRALRTLGVAERALATATIADADIPAFLALAEYHALQRLWRAKATASDVAARSVLGNRSQVFQQIKDLIAEAKERCQALGYSVTGTPGWQFGWLELDYLEPSYIEPADVDP